MMSEVVMIIKITSDTRIRFHDREHWSMTAVWSWIYLTKSYVGVKIDVISCFILQVIVECSHRIEDILDGVLCDRLICEEHMRFSRSHGLHLHTVDRHLLRILSRVSHVHQPVKISRNCAQRGRDFTGLSEQQYAPDLPALSQVKITPPWSTEMAQLAGWGHEVREVIYRKNIQEETKKPFSNSWRVFINSFCVFNLARSGLILKMWVVSNVPWDTEGYSGPVPLAWFAQTPTRRVPCSSHVKVW